jgi:hypothetical protein
LICRRLEPDDQIERRTQTLLVNAGAIALAGASRCLNADRGISCSNFWLC